MHKQVVEYAGIPVGVLIAEEDAFTFMAVKYQVMALDGRRFFSPGHARRSIRAHMIRAAMDV